MLCPFPSRKTGSSWLNRLRIAKGFPENDASDLEDFLQNPHSSSSDAPTPCPDKPPTFDSTKDEDLKLFHVICELFNFGDACCSSTKVKRFCRKQVNPRVCAFSDNGNAVIDNFDTEKTSANAASRSGDSYGGLEDLNESDERKDEGDGRDEDFPGFSRTEVTVIDTSYEQWKFEKLLLRKKNVWKVRDNKKTSEIWGSKKRRKLSGCIEDDRHAKKKHKVQDEDGCGVWCEPPFNRVYHPSHKLEDHERAPEVGKVLKMKQADLLSQELEKENSSVILIKGIPTSIKNRTSISKNCSNKSNLEGVS